MIEQKIKIPTTDQMDEMGIPQEGREKLIEFWQELVKSHFVLNADLSLQFPECAWAYNELLLREIRGVNDK